MKNLILIIVISLASFVDINAQGGSAGRARKLTEIFSNSARRIDRSATTAVRRARVNSNTFSTNRTGNSVSDKQVLGTSTNGNSGNSSFQKKSSIDAFNSKNKGSRTFGPPRTGRKSPAYIEAVKGGRYKKELANARKKTIPQLKKSITNHEKQMRIHKELIQNPTVAMKKYNKPVTKPQTPKNIAQQQNKWKKDLDRHKAYRDIHMGVLEEKLKSLPGG